MTDRERIFEAIAAERHSQDVKWGHQFHSMPVWSAILTEEVGEVAEAALRTHFHGHDPSGNLREELIQVAAVAVHIIENIDSGDWQRPEEPAV